MKEIAKRVTTSRLRAATVLLLGVALTAAGWFGTSPELLDAGLVVTAAGVLYGIFQLLLRRDA